ncbi:16S rRNA (guanine(966)-N(2))-methyltransferase RsmD [Aquihabitans sp. G128]|uniref:16S rRNA (guanine(966)-N(2))-methyltransferase RsmD n=1 Tax=Aquihabitans sp. G128 TaxID=2849779 RepID=UPI001C23B4FA|nr:16S rRNA (guanine(966)-N(2))-methyltransferase RsmD [Aquihabitans sp. G128]QXC62651.1 16S rRNA (guanine(966)-N(2))-methyltransferase RsmD [Aquihabitans sp. G128]
MSARKPPARPRGRVAPVAPTKGALRVVAGEARGRRLDVPPGTSTRPTPDRVRQAVFNALESLGAVDGAHAIDAFAGSGALGIEALSRGADHVVFAETDAAARSVVAANLAATGFAGRALVSGGDGRRAAGGGPWDLVLLDPPYAYDEWDALLAELLPALDDDAVVVIESDREVALPAGLRGIRVKQYGGTVVTFATPTGAPS